LEGGNTPLEEQIQEMRVQLSNPSHMAEFVSFLTVPQIALTRVDNDVVEIQPTSAAYSETYKLFLHPFLRAWNREHGEAAVRVVDEVG
jgi:hypothetical protein